MATVVLSSTASQPRLLLVGQRSAEVTATNNDRPDARSLNTITRVTRPLPQVHDGERHRAEVGKVVMAMRDRGDFVIYKKAGEKNRVYLTADELDDLAVALDAMLQQRQHRVDRVRLSDDRTG